MMKWLDWYGCYSGSLKGWIVPDAFAHPAKMSLLLTERIFNFLLEIGAIKKGDTVVDPFGGIGTTALVGANMGYRVVCVELEEKFVKLAEENGEMWKRRLDRIDKPFPVVFLQGDSRKLSEVLSRAEQSRAEQSRATEAIVTSPPFGDPHTGGGIMTKGYSNPAKRPGGVFDLVGQRHYSKEKHGENNIATLKEGDMNAVITSPPYAEIATGAGGLNTKPPKDGKGQSGRNPKSASQDTDQRYGTGDGQIARLKDKGVEAVLTSPPYEETASGKKNTNTNDAKRGYATKPMAYSKSPENIGNQVKETYWSAMAQVYGECYKVLMPGGWMAVVVKDFVRKKSRVPLCDSTVKLLEHLGFKVECRARAWLTTDKGVPDLFHGRTQKSERKSFFRRLAESKGSPRIDWEEVIFARKPSQAKPSQAKPSAVVTSPPYSETELTHERNFMSQKNPNGQKARTVSRRW